ncbi:actin-binding Rho-activating protein-like isoform X1 [Thrips palmi]|uniref:Actin-binding Rho-activating protein-like isoform X1 n=2 Tax=Thrips palmi TaxID=161013 RepID=A0A6P9ABE5_THRPL|nr:actin-binding Rho-activating protein-like isoform X1 [Thrips palmi]
MTDQEVSSIMAQPLPPALCFQPISASPPPEVDRETQRAADMRFAASLAEKVSLFNQQADRHIKKQELNPFSAASSRSGSRSPRPTFSKDQYGKPPPGSESEYRAIKGRISMNKDILELCEILNQEGELQIVDGMPVKVMCFRDVFQLYTVINDKVVGLLLRARKQGLVDFEGETLFQRRDDHVLIGLIKPIEEIRVIFRKHFDDLKEEERRNKEAAQSQVLQVPNY